MRRRHRKATRRRRYSIRRRRGVSNIAAKGGIWKLLNIALPSAAMAEQITKKSRTAGDYNNLSTFDSMKQGINNLFGNAIGFNPFKSVKHNYVAQRNLNGIANSYTGIGIGSLVGKLILKQTGIKVPYLSRVLGIGTKMLVPGIVGGYLDDAPTNSYVHTSVASGQNGNYAFTSNWSSLQQ